MKSKVFEGMRTGDLEGLVMSFITINEYESKISDDALVIAFYVDDIPPATDLNNFINKSEFDILSSEISKVPNTAGKYVVFVEVVYEKETAAQTIVDLLESLRGITRIKKWKYKIYGGEITKVSKENLETSLKTTMAESFIADTVNAEITSTGVKIGSDIFEIVNFGKLSYVPQFGHNVNYLLGDLGMAWTATPTTSDTIILEQAGFISSMELKKC